MNFRFPLTVLLILTLGAPINAQSTQNQPRLIVGIVVDQMRDDFLSRFEELYGPDGLNRLRREGFYAANHHFSYVPTYTAPGHASIFTGTTPAVHGIVGNDWYDPRIKDMMYCVGDSGVTPLGVDNASGRMSPRNLKTTTITDELKLFWNDRSKVVGVSFKDRGAILPAGHLADGAYWLSEDMNFVSSSWYFDKLPTWVEKFNSRKLADTYLSQNWNLLLPQSKYAASLPDDNPYEYIAPGEEAPVMPKNLAAIAEKQGAFNTLATSPFGTSLTFDFAKAAIAGENMGQDEIPDFLTISLSSPDFLGHSYGPRAVEVQDAYLRLDLDLAEFLDFLDREVGLGHCLIFLTADHGGAEPAMFSVDRGLPGGLFDRKEISEELKGSLEEKYSGLDTLIEKISGNKIFLNKTALRQKGLNPVQVARDIAAAITELEGVYAAYAVEDLMQMSEGLFPINFIQRGLYPALAGDVVWILESGWMRYAKTGTTHGSPYAYDTHVPFLIWGGAVEPGTTYRKTFIRDVAPTISMMLGISLPSGCTGDPIEEAIGR